MEPSMNRQEAKELVEQLAETHLYFGDKLLQAAVGPLPEFLHRIERALRKAQENLGFAVIA